MIAYGRDDSGLSLFILMYGLGEVVKFEKAMKAENNLNFLLTCSIFNFLWK